MPAYRYFIDQPFIESTHVILEEQEFHHFSTVMRGKKGEFLELINGRNQLANAEVIDTKRHEATLRINTVQLKPPPSFNYVVAQSIAKLNRLEYVFEKCTELGATEFWLFPSERSDKKELSKSQQERLMHILISATKQCGRLDLPKLILKPTFSFWTKEPNTLLLFGDTSKQAPGLKELLKDKQKIPKIIFIVGPESGFSEIEHRDFIKNGALGVKLHSNILRTDTASIVALAVIHNFLDT